MLQDQITQVVKHSVAYSYAFSQPFSFYVDAYPILQNEWLEQNEMLEFGIQHESVKTLQHKLQKLSYYDSSIDGEFGLLTEYALKKFQNDYLMENHGKADKETVEAILDKEEVYYRDLLISEDNSFTIGDTGEEVEELQEALFYFGYYLAEVDGIFGEKSKQALKQFKEDRGIETYHISAEIKNVVNETPQAAAISTEESTPATDDAQAEETIEEESEAAEEATPASISASHNHREQIAAAAKEFIGVPYQWGGTNTSGFDCSGYLQYVFSQSGITLPRTVSDMWNAAKAVETPSIGDLVFFETYKPGPSHAGIYVGDGKFIHAGESNGVTISELNGSYWKDRYLGSKRVVSE